jgi:hypothetical protein
LCANAGIDAAGFQAGGIEWVNADVRVVHGLLSVENGGLNDAGSFVDVEGAIGPVGKNVVAGNPDKALVPWDGAEMAGDINQAGKRIAPGIVAENLQLRIGRHLVARGVDLRVAVNQKQVFRFSYIIHGLAIACLLLLAEGDTLRAGGPVGQGSGDQGMVGGAFLEDLEGADAHDVESYALVAMQAVEEGAHLLANTGEISP